MTFFIFLFFKIEFVWRVMEWKLKSLFICGKELILSFICRRVDLERKTRVLRVKISLLLRGRIAIFFRKKKEKLQIWRSIENLKINKQDQKAK